MVSADRPAPWSASDGVSAVSAVVVAVSLFLPWYGVAIGFVGVTASGLSVHSYLWVAFALCILQLLALLVASRQPEPPSRVPVRRDALAAECSLLALALVVAAFLAKGSAASGWHYGAFVALSAAAVGAVVKLAAAVSGRVPVG